MTHFSHLHRLQLEIDSYLRRKDLNGNTGAIANRIRLIFKEAFKAAGLPYFNPHSFRNTLASLGEKICKTPEDFKAWSQNLGHEKVLTTFYSYGEVPEQRQSEIIQHLSQDTIGIRHGYDELADVIVERLKKEAV